jgi:uncharacterized protein YcfJ
LKAAWAELTHLFEENAMSIKRFLCLSVCAGAAAAAMAQPGAAPMGRVLSVTPAVEDVAVPRQVCDIQPVVTQAAPSGLGAVAGAVAGGVVGNAIGGGSGRAAATALGLFGGAVLGNQAEVNGSTRVQNMQSCSTQTAYERRTVGYDVTYEYAGRKYHTRMESDPGAYVPVEVGVAGYQDERPAPEPGVYATQPQPGVVVPAGYPTSAPVYDVPQAPVVIAPPAYYAPAPVYAAPSYYAPAYAAPPVGISLNLGYSRGYGGHWR